MNKAIERIKGFCCEVNEQQWNELVRVADEVGVDVRYGDRSYSKFKSTRAGVFDVNTPKLTIIVISDHYLNEIPYSSFLAKLKGEEEDWQPKAGEMVEVSDFHSLWCEAEFVAKSHGQYVVWTQGERIQAWNMCRPLTHTITRAEAEKQLGKRIID